MERACERSKRNSRDIQLILVTKQVSVQAIEEAYQLGIRDFGENRIQEWLDKKNQLPKDIRWHLIGHLQTNKVRFCVGEFELIHSVDSKKLALAIDREGKARKIRAKCLIQVNTSGEATKSGIEPNQLRELVLEISRCSHIQIQGLMTIGPLTEDPSKTRASFQTLHHLYGEMRDTFPKEDWRYLSMGMSSDFEIAIEEGANLLRIGTAVFGERAAK